MTHDQSAELAVHQATEWLTLSR